MKKRIPVRLLTICAMLTALTVVLNRFGSIHTAGWTIGFSFIPVVAAAILYGPVTAAVVGGLSDLIGALLFPFGPYFPGFTATAALMGAVYGWFLYGKDPIRREKTDRRSKKHRGKRTYARFFPDVILPTLINNVVLGLYINTIWVSILYDSRNYGGWFAYRLPEYAVLVPLNLIFIPILLTVCRRLRKFAGGGVFRDI